MGEKGIIPIYEPADQYRSAQLRSRPLHFTTDLPSVLNDMDMVLLLWTPSDETGNADLSAVFVARPLPTIFALC